MQPKPIRLKYIDLICGLSEAIDLINPAVAYHHTQVAMITWMLSEALAFSKKRTRDLVMAASLHDIGGLTLQDRLGALQFEIKHPHQHSENGYRLLKEFPAFKNPARIIRFHHVSWDNGKGIYFMGHKVPYDCHVLHLADRISVLINNKKEILSQVQKIRDKIIHDSDDMFDPKLVHVFQKIAEKEYFWLELESTSMDVLFRERMKLRQTYLRPNDIILISRLFSRIVDFRSNFTATHSSGVAAVASAIAKASGMTNKEVDLIRIAGYLHDLGKLAVPAEILEKPGKLTETEFNVIRKHSYYTQAILQKIGLEEEFIYWAAYHHENLSGDGYPFHVKHPQISKNSRIMAVSDVFTALTEDRPYRRGMTESETILVMQKFVESDKLDADIVSILLSSLKDVNMQRERSQAEAVITYKSFRRQMLQTT